MTHYIIIITVIISVSAFYNPNLLDKWIFFPYRIFHEKQYYRFITSGFLHANWMHLIINMFVLWSFSQNVESYYKAYFGMKGIYYYLLLYLAAIVISDFTTFIKNKDNPYYRGLGASGAVSAVVFASILFNPMGQLLIWGVLPIPAVLFGILYLVFSAYYAKSSQGNINHDAHFYGAVFGFLYTLLLKPGLFLDFIEQIKNAF